MYSATPITKGKNCLYDYNCLSYSAQPWVKHILEAVFVHYTEDFEVPSLYIENKHHIKNTLFCLLTSMLKTITNYKCKISSKCLLHVSFFFIFFLVKWDKLCSCFLTSPVHYYLQRKLLKPFTSYMYFGLRIWLSETKIVIKFATTFNIAYRLLQ